jgi:SAM-dependent methyltransferase
MTTERTVSIQEATVADRAIRETREADRVRTLFDAKAATWPAKYAPGGRLAGRLTRLAAVLNRHVTAGDLVLDLGCGTGELARHLTPGGRVDWVQLAPHWRRLPFRSACFDAVVAASVLEYTRQPRVVVRECSRVLRPGGIMLCTVPDPVHPVRLLEWLVSKTATVPPVAAVSHGWPRLDRYLTYLCLSRQRHRASWWRAVTAHEGLSAAAVPDGPALRSPLRLLVFQRSDYALERT